MAFRALISKPSISLNLSHFFSPSRSFASKPLSITAFTRPSSVLRFGRRHLISLAETGLFPADLSGSGGLRCFSTRPTTSSLNDPSPNWSNRPPKETILLDGCDFEHWLVVMDPPEGSPTRDEIIDSYIKTLAEVIGSEDEARMKIYSVSTRCYFAFGALVSEELSYKIKALPRVRWVLPDSYLDVKNKDYGGEPFIDGVAVPYDPKYHEEWIRNNARANERSRRNDRPRNFDRSRNFERRRENMQNRGDFPNRDVPPMPNQEFQNRDGQNPIPPRDVPPPLPNRDGQSTMPPRDIPQPQYSNRDAGSMPNRDFQGRDGPNRDFQGRDGPNRDFQGGGGYQGGGNAYQGGGGGYQGGGNAYQGGGGAYPGSGNAYQGGGGAAYQGSGNVPQGGGGAAAYQGSGNVPRGGGGAVYQGSGNVPQGGGGAYQGSGYPTQGGGGAYQGSGYPTQGGGGAYQGGGGTYQGNGNTYQGRDMPPLPNREPQ